MKPVWILGMLVLMSFSDFRSATDFPVPPHTKQTLFYIYRNLNHHSVVYEVNKLPNGSINPKDPFRIYWNRVGEKNRHRDLNYMERTFAYGLKWDEPDNGKVHAAFVARKGYEIDVLIDEKGQANALMKIDNKISKLVKIFVQVAEDGWWPKIAYVEFYGIDFMTKLPTYQKLVIN